MTDETTRGPHALTIYHANAKNTGSAVRIYVRTARPGHDGGATFKIAPQNGADGFDFSKAKAVTVHLGPVEVAEMLMVFGGHTSALCHGGIEGIFHDLGHKTVSLNLKRAEDPCRPGFLLGIVVNFKAYPDRRNYRTFAFTPAEAFAVRAALTAQMGSMTFGEDSGAAPRNCDVYTDPDEAQEAYERYCMAGDHYGWSVWIQLPYEAEGGAL